MPIRTSVPEVLALVGTTSLDDATVVGIIADVSGWIDRELEDACEGQTPESLEAIERYLSAHLVTKGGSAGSAASGTLVLKRSTRSDVTDEYETSAAAATAAEAPTRFANAAASFDRCGIVGEVWLGKRRARASFIRGYADV